MNRKYALPIFLIVAMFSAAFLPTSPSSGIAGKKTPAPEPYPVMENALPVDLVTLDGDDLTPEPTTYPGPGMPDDPIPPNWLTLNMVNAPYYLEFRWVIPTSSYPYDVAYAGITYYYSSGDIYESEAMPFHHTGTLSGYPVAYYRYYFTEIETHQSFMVHNGCLDDIDTPVMGCEYHSVNDHFSYIQGNAKWWMPLIIFWNCPLGGC